MSLLNTPIIHPAFFHSDAVHRGKFHVPSDDDAPACAVHRLPSGDMRPAFGRDGPFPDRMRGRPLLPVCMDLLQPAVHRDSRVRIRARVFPAGFGKSVLDSGGGVRRRHAGTADPSARRTCEVVHRPLQIHLRDDQACPARFDRARQRRDRRLRHEHRRLVQPAQPRESRLRQLARRRRLPPLQLRSGLHEWPHLPLPERHPGYFRYAEGEKAALEHRELLSADRLLPADQLLCEQGALWSK